MRIAFAGQFVLIAEMAVFVGVMASGQSQQPTLHQGFVDVPGAKIYYTDSGGPGAPVIFLHAPTGSAEVWEKQIPAFTRAGYRFIAYERRGFGRTVADAKGPPSTSPDDLLALVDYLRIVSLGGHCGRWICGARFRDFVPATRAQLYPALLTGWRARRGLPGCG